MCCTSSFKYKVTSYFTAHSSSLLPRLSLRVFPFLTRLVPGLPARALGSPCCPWVPGSLCVDGYCRPDCWPLSRLSGPPVFCHQNCVLCQSGHVVPSPHVYTTSSVLPSFCHTWGSRSSLPSAHSCRDVHLEALSPLLVLKG